MDTGRYSTEISYRRLRNNMLIAGLFKTVKLEKNKSAGVRKKS